MIRSLLAVAIISVATGALAEEPMTPVRGSQPAQGGSHAQATHHATKHPKPITIVRGGKPMEQIIPPADGDKAVTVLKGR